LNFLLPLVMPCAPGFSSLCWLEAKRIKFTFNEVLIGMPTDARPLQAGGVPI